LNVQHILLLIRGADAKIDIVLKRQADEIRHRVLRGLRERLFGGRIDIRLSSAWKTRVGAREQQTDANVR